MPVVTIAGEGRLDLEVAERLVLHYGGEVGNRYDKGGKFGVHSKINGYNDDAIHTNTLWLVLLDLNSDECPIGLRNRLLPDLAPSMCFRIAVREIESWLMGDRESLGAYLGVSKAQIPRDPEKIANPKEALTQLARESNKREIREGVARKNAIQLETGPRYTALLRKYVKTNWRPEVAATRVDSLNRALHCVEQMLGSHSKDTSSATSPSPP